MRKQNLLYLLMLVLACIPMTGHSQVSNDSEDGVNKIGKHARLYKEGELIVKFKSNGTVMNMPRGAFKTSSVSAVDRVMIESGVSEVEPLMPFTDALGVNSARKVRGFNGIDVEVKDLSKLYIVRLDANKQTSVSQAIEKFKELEEVEFAEPNYIVYAMASGDGDTYKKEPLYKEQWGLSAINIYSLWNAPRISAKRPVIAILDTGVDITHPDLADNIWTNNADADGDGSDSDGNGFTDDIHGWDFVNNSGNMRDNNGHGTHCAGIAAAVGDNGIGITGANPDAYIMPVTVLQSNGQGDVATIIKGVDYAVANGADIISMSFGNYTHSVAEEQALAKAYSKCVLVAAAGNDGHDMKNDKHHVNTPMGCLGCKPVFPAALNWVIGVMASQERRNLSHSVYKDTYLADFSNYDCDGPIYSSFDEEKLYNYEIMAPGTHILSTFPDGQYKYLNGTSMACPLVAGAISRMMESREETSKEEILADLIQSSKYKVRDKNPYALGGLLDITAASVMTENTRPVDIAVVSVEVDDSEGDNDKCYDAGETIILTPVIRCISGNTYGVKVWLELADMEDPNIVEFIDNYVDFGHSLGTYAKHSSVTPLKIRISPSCADKREIGLILKAQGANMHTFITKEFPITIESGVELRGVLQEDMTLSPENSYVISSDFCIPEGRTLRILPGTKITLRNLPHILDLNYHNKGIIAEGEPGNMITIECEDYVSESLSGYARLETYNRDRTFKYVRFKGPIYSKVYHVENCIFENVYSPTVAFSHMESSNVIDCLSGNPGAHSGSNNNIINNTLPSYTIGGIIGMSSSNIFNNYYNDQEINLAFNSETTTMTPGDLYFGSSVPSIIKNTMVDVEHPVYPFGYGVVDISNVATRPSAGAHGIVWKVLVDGIEPRDEADKLPSLGVGRHKFEVYYNRPVDKSVEPLVSMGVRAPYSQTPILEETGWNEAGDIYTAYLTITAKRGEEGLNRISVRGGQDLECFEIPIEASRYNVMIQKAGSLSAGMMASAGVACVKLRWDTPETTESEDVMGYNLCRYTINANSQCSDTIIINKQLMDISELSFTDYDVHVGTSYYYYLSEISTDLKSSPVTNTVTATPLTVSMGDSNGSGAVDVADVVTDIAYMTGQSPYPFVYDAADINTDKNINILDVVGTVRVILGLSDAAGARHISDMDSPVEFSMSNGILSMSSDQQIAGLQIHINHDPGAIIHTLEGVKGFEVTCKSLSETETLCLIYSLTGKTWSPGTTPLLAISSLFDVSSVIASDVRGHSIASTFSDATSMQGEHTFASPYGYTTITAIDGRRVCGTLSRGIYIVTQYDKNGNVIQSKKRIISK